MKITFNKKFIIKFLLYSCLAAFFISAIILSKKKEELKRFISFEKMKTDYEYFWDFIYTGYPFTEVCERQGVDLKYLKETSFSNLEKVYTEKDYYEFYNLLCRAITSDKYFGHLYPNNVSYSTYFDGNFSSKLFDDYRSLVHNFYSNFAKQSGLNLRHSVYPAKDSPTEIYVSQKMIEDKKIAYIKVNSFLITGIGQRKKYLDTIDKFFLETSGYKHIIIDIRDNGGGAYEDALLLIEPHLKENTYYKRYVLYNENKYTKPYLDFMCSRHQSIESIEKSNIPNIQNCGTIKNDKAYAITEYAALRPIMGYKLRKDKKFWLLINNGCYSASDKLASACKRIGFAVLVGENTGGAGMNGLYPMHFVLPNSGLIFFFDYVYGLNTEGYCQDEVGTAPDIYNLPGKDALETCLEEIRKLGERTNF